MVILEKLEKVGIRPEYISHSAIHNDGGEWQTVLLNLVYKNAEARSGAIPFMSNYVQTGGQIVKQGGFRNLQKTTGFPKE